MKSLLWHSVRSLDNQKLVAEPEEPGGDEDGREWADRQEYEMAGWRSRGAETPLGLLLEGERQIVGSRAMELLLIECREDEILLLMSGGTTKPAVIAQELGLQVKEVYVAIKRLERKFIVITERVKEELGVGSRT